MSEKPALTDGEHYRAIDVALDAVWGAVKAARKAGLTVHAQMTADEDSDDIEWSLWVNRKITEESP